MDKPINGWLDFEDECKMLLGSKKQWVFRGQNSVDYDVVKLTNMDKDFYVFALDIAEIEIDN
ncbi:hypothetical protein [Bacillus cereus]|uniref:hypothetical protein n=1 Tax=Bacillus cereus TaxID=1396 RepID=UPI0039DF318B